LFKIDQFTPITIYNRRTKLQDSGGIHGTHINRSLGCLSSRRRRLLRL